MKKLFIFKLDLIRDYMYFKEAIILNFIYTPYTCFKEDIYYIIKIFLFFYNLIFHIKIVEGASAVTKLSTFMGGLSNRSNSNMVQMRRSTNKKGKQAPAPPKRTRYVKFLFNIT
jgi:hypothetical protein